MVAIETLYLTALLSAFIGLIALFALSQPATTPLTGMRHFLGNLIIVAAIVSVASFLFYAISPHYASRQVYGGGPGARITRL